MTVSINEVVVIPPPFVALTTTVKIPVGCALVTRTTPVTGSTVKTPLKLLVVETLILVAPVGATSGVTVEFEPTTTVVFG